VHVVWETAASLDGRIASPQHSLAFLDAIDTQGESGAFESFLATIDAVLVGASTLRWLVGQGHGWPHDDLPTWLLSHDEALAEAVRPTRAPLNRAEGDVGAVLDRIEAAGHERVWLAGGGDVAGQALALDRLDEIALTVAPVALGAGPAVVDALDLPARRFELVECARAGNAARLRWLRRR
jgi:riboflavin biosynthesis pyrimidine reductase